MPQIIDLDSGELKEVESATNKADTNSATQPKASTPRIIDLGEAPQQGRRENQYAFNANSPDNKRDIENALTPLPSVDVSNIDGFDAFWSNVGRGAYDVWRGMGEGEPETRDKRQVMDAIEEEYPVTSTVGRVSGQAAPFLIPGTAAARLTAGASLPARVAMGSTLGATEANIISEGLGASDDEKIAATGIGGVIGGATEVVFPLLGRLGNATVGKWLGRKPKAPVINKLGEPSKDLQDALNKAGISYDEFLLDAEKQLADLPVGDQSLIRRRALSEAGVNNPTRAQLTGDASDFQAQQELFKTGGPVRATIEDQDKQLRNTLDQAVTQSGKPSSQFSYNPVTNFVSERSLELDSAINNAYKSARESTNNSKVISPNNLVEKLRGIAGAETASGGVYSAVKGFLKQKGLLTGKKLKVNGLIDADTAEELRIDINSLYNSVSPLGKSQLRELKEALDNDVLEFAGEDAFKEARRMKANFEKDLTRTKVNKFDQRNKEFLRDILENKYNPDTFFNDAILTKSTRASDINQVKQYLDNADTPDAVEAWNSIRADAAEYIRDNSFNEVSGVMSLSRAKLQKSLNKLGKDKMQVLFDNDERKFFDLMLQVSKIREPSSGTQQGLGPSAQAIKGLFNNMSTSNSLMYDLYKTMKLNGANKEMLITIEPPLTPLKQEARAAGVATATSYMAKPETEEESN